MSSVLVATLGASPIVVTAMVSALREKQGVIIEKLHILYPGAETDRLIGLGYEMIAQYLDGECQVQPWPLEFVDINSYETSIQFLRCLANVLDLCEQSGDTVYLSLAGGRKNMSALLAVISQFYPCIHGLYHLLDIYEYDPRRRNLYTIEELVDMSEAHQTAKLSPPVDSLKLVEIPFHHFANGVELRRYFAAEESGQEFAVETSGMAQVFFGSVFKADYSAGFLNVFLSPTAYHQFQDMALQGGERLKNFLKCFQQMQDPNALKGHIHGTFSAPGKVFHFFKLRRTTERPFYYTVPEPIHLFPQRKVESVIVCGLSVEQSNGTYKPSAEQLLRDTQVLPYKHISNLVKNETVLVVPLGESPMIATQTYTLLQKRQEISPIVVIYPEDHAPIRNGVNILADLCRRRKILFEKKPIHGLRDIDSYAACQTYLSELLHTLNEVRLKYPHKQIALSLSGGRKGMSALTLFAAQYFGIDYIYHTLITDPDLENQIEQECSYEELIKLNAAAQADRLFLESYDHHCFTLFPIPVIPAI